MNIFKTRNEKRLALLLGVAVACVAGLALAHSLLGARGHLVAGIHSLKDEREQAKMLLEDRVLWEKREQWLDASQPQLTDARQQSAALLSEIESSAQKSGMEVSSKAIGEAETGRFFTGLPIRIQATGDIRSLSTWLLEFQKPGNFVMVRGLTIKAAAREGLVDCNVEFVRCYSPSKTTTAQK